MKCPFKSIAMSAAAVGALCAGPVAAGEYKQTNLVSDIPSLATVTDPNLKNPWGVSYLPGSPFWVSDQGSNLSTLYAVTGATNVAIAALKVGIPTTAGGPQGPTGQVANPNAASFLLGDGSSALFIFANLNGQISAWNSGLSPITKAVTEYSNPGAVYTGLAINQAHSELYAVDNAAGTVNVLNSSFMPTAPGTFATPSSIASLGLAPFNVQDLSGNVYVTYAPTSLSGQVNATPGEGAVAEFSEAGSLEKIVVGGGAGGPLASPWGVALAPSGFGQFSGDLLVGNFSSADSGIDAINPSTGMLAGMIPIDPGAGNSAGGLWALTFGGGGRDGAPNVLYFADGINGQADGLFGAIESVPETSTWLMMLFGFGGLGLLLALRQAKAGPQA